MKLKSVELAEYVGECWGKNCNDFISCFTEDGVIDHPFFSEVVSPTVALEVLNSTCRVNTKFNKCEIIKGNGEGLDDVIRMEFIENGTCAGYTPKYSGNMIVDAWVKDGKFTKFKVYGYDVISESKDINAVVRFSQSTPYQFISVDNLLADIANAWMNNDMDKFISFFSNNAKIYHPIMNKPATPEEIADIINSGTKGISIPKKARLIKGDGSGKKDVVDLYFEETGKELGYVPGISGLMHVTINLSDGLISEMMVHGYTPIKSSIGVNASSTILSEVSKQIKVENR